MFPDGGSYPPSFRDLIFPARLSLRERVVSSVSISTAGANYTVGDTIGLAGGVGSSSTALTVAALSGSGVSSVTLTYGTGAYTTPPPNPVAQASSSSIGTGAAFDLFYDPVYRYSWEEQGTDEDGNLNTIPLPRSGTAFVSSAVSMNNLALDVSGQPYVWGRLRAGPGGVLVYDFEEWLLGSADLFAHSDTATTKLTYKGTGGLTVTLTTGVAAGGTPGDDTLTFNGSATAGTGIDVVGDGVSDTHHCVGDSTIHFINSKIACGPGDATVTSRERFYLNSSSASFAVEPGINLVEGTGITINVADDTVNSRGSYLISATGSASSSLTVRDQHAHVVTGTSTITMVDTPGSNTFTVSGGAGAASISLAIAPGSSTASIAFSGARTSSDSFGSSFANGVPTKLKSDAITGTGSSYDTDSYWATGSGDMTIPLTGWYNFSAWSEWNDLDVGGWAELKIQKASAGFIVAEARLQVSDNDTPGLTLSCAGDASFGAGDLVNYWVTQSGSSDHTLNQAWMMVHKLPGK